MLNVCNTIISSNGFCEIELKISTKFLQPNIVSEISKIKSRMNLLIINFNDIMMPVGSKNELNYPDWSRAAIR